ncbi:Suppressor of Sensor Kinase (SLN1) [Tulasnella sp. 418]|nr:Suppressor of Sensor Kinase (SLN1) [Tulasnella sp. 418]
MAISKGFVTVCLDDYSSDVVLQENVLVDANGHASLCDFGMSQFVEEATRITGFTTTNAYLGGTDRFMCPELLDERPKTTATDIWALGCLIVQVRLDVITPVKVSDSNMPKILTDEIPYQRISRKQAVMMAISRGEQPMLNLNGAIEKSSWEIIKKCWSSDPARRPSAIDMKSHFDPDDNPEGPPSLSDLVCSNFLSDSHHSVPYIEFDPGGGLLAVARSNGDVKIFEVGKNTLNLIRTWKCLNWVASLFIWRVAWSITERHIFIVSHQFTRIYVVETGELVKDLGLTRTAAFVFNSPNIAFVPRSSGDMAQSTITFQHFTGIGAERLRLTSCPKNIIDVGFIDNERVVLASPGILYIYNFKSEKTETRTPVKEGLQMLSTSRDGSFVLMVYDAEHPEVWKVSVANRKYRANQIQLSYLHQYRSPKGDERFRGRYTKVQFGGLDDQMIIGLWIFQKLYIWNRDTSALVHSIPLTQSGCIWDMSFRWNSVNPKDIMLVVASWAGYQIWSVSDPGAIETTGPEADLNDTTETTRDDEEDYSLAESVDPGESQPSVVETNQTIQHASQQHPRPYIYYVPPPPSITVNGHLYTTPHL